jgi:hypothetical protein
VREGSQSPPDLPIFLFLAPVCPSFQVTTPEVLDKQLAVSTKAKQLPDCVRGVFRAKFWALNQQFYIRSNLSGQVPTR